VIDIIKEKTCVVLMGRQDVRRTHEGLNPGVHFVHCDLPLSDAPPDSGKGIPAGSGRIWPMTWDRAVKHLAGVKWQQFCVVLPGQKSSGEILLGLTRIGSRRHFEVNLDGDNPAS